ncbi:hypothetical protein ERHA55_12820 [Erwinia rhapontici]|nr:hypothetical protein ERHA55_12820 [Erwinia rhapontici]
MEFIALLSDVHFAITAENENFDKGIGTGAFILESFKPGVRTLVKRNPNHWNPARGHVDSVETLAMNDSTARVAALASGSAHIINRVNPRIVDRLKNMPTIQLLRSRDSQIFTFPGLATAAPFNTLDGRLALKYAIDREQIIKTVLGGYGTVANDNRFSRPARTLLKTFRSVRMTRKRRNITGRKVASAVRWCCRWPKQASRVRSMLASCIRTRLNVLAFR